MLYELASMNAAKGWVQQFHFGAMRNNNTRMFQALGPDTGFDSIGDFEVARPMARFLDRLDRAGRLAKTILYNLNPAHNEVVATMIGNFQDGATPGKMQYGSGWWFLDQKDGMERQLGSLSNQGLLSRFVGMLTDSRSFLSYTRHEYFRRILCNLLGTEMEQGLLPDDMGLIGPMVRDICYGNAAGYFGFDVPPLADASDERAFRPRTRRSGPARRLSTADCSVARPIRGLCGRFARPRESGPPRHRRRPACRERGSRPPESRTARSANSTASAPLRTEAFWSVASSQAVSFSKTTSLGASGAIRAARRAR